MIHKCAHFRTRTMETIVTGGPGIVECNVRHGGCQQVLCSISHALKERGRVRRGGRVRDVNNIHTHVQIDVHMHVHGK